MSRLPKMIRRSSRWIGVAAIFILSAFLVIASHFKNTPDSGTALWQLSSNWENRFYDFRLKNHLQKQKIVPSPHAVLAAIDEKSIQHLGRFPWTRSVWAQLLDQLNAFNAKVVAFDIIFSEQETACENNPDGDFAQAIKRFHQGPGHVIVGHSRTHVASAAAKQFPDILYYHLLNTRQAGKRSFPHSFVQQSTFPIDTLVRTNLGVGLIDMQNDQDGVFRNYITMANIIDPQDLTESNPSQIFPSFGLLAYMKYRGDNVSVEIAQNGHTAWMATQQGTIELDAHAAIKLRYRGGRGAFTEISIRDILQAPPNDLSMRQLIQDKAVFIGPTAFAAHDFRNSPVDTQLPGVFFHLNLLDMLSSGRFFRPPDQGLWITLGIFLLGSVLILFIQRMQNVTADLLSTLLVMTAVYFLDTRYLLPQGYEIKLFFCLTGFFTLYLWNTIISFYQTIREKRQVRATFSRYVSPGIVNQILEHPHQLKMGGEKKDITVFFSDVRDFTSISEKLSPTQLADCLNQYMNKMTQILFHYKGTLDKYIGDAIVGYWGAPIALEHHPYLATKAAVEMIEVLPRINRSFEQQGLPPFQVGIGINTGECSVGNMGSDQIFSYTALGDHMNLGARLEGLCKFYQVEIIISELTFNRLTPQQKQEMCFRSLGLVRVKGKVQAVKIYEVLSCHHPLHQDTHTLSVYHQAYQKLLARDFQQAIHLLRPILAQYPKDQPCRQLAATARQYLQHPPPESWDGTLIMTTK